MPLCLALFYIYVGTYASSTHKSIFYRFVFYFILFNKILIIVPRVHEPCTVVRINVNNFMALKNVDFTSTHLTTSLLLKVAI